MIRFLLRFLGLWLLAGGFVALVLDGVRSIASSQIVLTPLAVTWETVSASSLAAFQALVETHTSSRIWEQIVAPALSAPLFAILGGAGIVLLWLGRRRNS